MAEQSEQQQIEVWTADDAYAPEPETPYWSWPRWNDQEKEWEDD